jgi:hypothetical protein
VRRALALRMGYPMRTLSRLMSFCEFLQWVEAFAEQPFDDYALVQVPTAKLQASIFNTGVRSEAHLKSAADFLPKPVFKGRPVLKVDDNEVVVFDEQVMRLQ